MKSMRSLLVVGCLLGGMIFTPLVLAQEGASAPSVTPGKNEKTDSDMMKTTRPHKFHNERYPATQSAIHKLSQAKQDLEQGEPDKDGHRAKALRAVNEALKELKAVLEDGKK